MARHNPIFGRDAEIRGGQSVATYGQPAPQYGYGQQQSAPGMHSDPQYGQPGPQQTQYSQPGYGARPEDLEAMYRRPSAGAADTGRMTIQSAVNATLATVGLIIVVGLGVGLLPLAGSIIGGQQGYAAGTGIAMIAMIIGLIGGLVLGLVNAFTKQPHPVLVLLYAVFEGLIVGGISGFMEMQYPGIVLQAVVATFAVAGSILLGVKAGFLRTSPRLTKIFAYAVVGYLLFSVFNIGYILIMGDSLRSGLFGMVIGAIAVVLASYSLVMDFEDVQQAANAGVPARYAWRCAFGIAATLVWMYIEILRLISIFRD